MYEYLADQINQQFKQHGPWKKPGRILPDTVRHGILLKNRP